MQIFGWYFFMCLFVSDTLAFMQAWDANVKTFVTIMMGNIIAWFFLIITLQIYLAAPCSFEC